MRNDDDPGPSAESCELRKSGGAYSRPHSRPPHTSLIRYIIVKRLGAPLAARAASAAGGSSAPPALHEIGAEKSDHSTSVPMLVPDLACARTLNHQVWLALSPANATVGVDVAGLGA